MRKKKLYKIDDGEYFWVIAYSKVEAKDTYVSEHEVDYSQGITLTKGVTRIPDEEEFEIKFESLDDCYPLPPNCTIKETDDYEDYWQVRVTAKVSDWLTLHDVGYILASTLF